MTHFLMSKLEIWFALFCYPVYGMKDPQGVMEFAKKRSAIHFHLLVNSELSANDEMIDMTMADWADSVSAHVGWLHSQILELWVGNNDSTHTAESAHNSADGPLPPPGKNALAKCKEYLQQLARGKQIWDQYERLMALSKKTAGDILDKLLSEEFGMTAFHPGMPPEDWPAPGGLPDQGYRSSYASMQTQEDILAKGKLRQFKASREDHLHERYVNITNHTHCHWCSGYCSREKRQAVLFDPAKHRADDPTKFEQDGRVMVTTTFLSCRFGFGNLLDYDPSGQNNKTRSIERIDDGKVEVDGNGQPRFYASCNHPRVVQEPVGTSWFGANSDLQFVLTNHLTHKRVVERGESCDAFLSNLCIAGMLGLDQFHGSEIMENYVISYQCKGQESSAHWDAVLRSIAERHISTDRGDRSWRSLIASYMNEISASRSVPKDKAVFLLSQGKLTFSPGSNVKMCSVSSVPLDSFANPDAGSDDASPPPTNSFTFPVILKRYKERHPDLEDMGLCKFVALHFFPNSVVVPHFFGYSYEPSWPLTESYAKWTLVLYKPW